ncbi:serine/arginine repetitive matrix protein 1-like isoform X1, partial [Clarias magur]
MGNGEHMQPLVSSHTNYGLDKLLIKRYFKLIQATHHSEVVENSIQTGRFPGGMHKQANKLTQFIKPASPQDSTLEKIKRNTLAWMNNNMYILSEHYTQVIIDLMEHISEFIEPEWTVAVKWARGRFKHRLKESTLATCKDTILEKQATLLRDPGPQSYASVLKRTNSAPTL